MRRSNILIFTCLIILAMCSSKAMAQTELSGKTYRVGIIAPLYLDSVYKNGSYQYTKNFPRFVVPGLDFVQGALIALDSMPLYDAHVDARVFDSKSTSEPLDSLIAAGALDSLNLIIGSVRDQEYLDIAAVAKEKHIPFISATHPNDGGVTANPFLVIMNSTLRAHSEAIQQILVKSHKKDNIILVKKSGTQEDKVTGFITQANDQDWGASVKFKTFHTDSNFHALKTFLDSNRNNVIIGASLDEEFASGLAVTSAGLNPKYKIKLIGMPNWETFASFVHPKKAIVSDFPVYFTSPYHNLKIDTFSRMLQDVYLKKYKGKPSDHAYKGFETTYLFTKLMAMYSGDLMNHLNDFPYKLYSEFNFKPVITNRSNGKPDFFENKHLYQLKILHGQISRAW